jgi:hypothetical protein
MEAIAIYEIDEQFENTGEVPGFHINDDSAAEWAIKKIADRRAELSRQEMAIKTMISYYEHKLVKLREKAEHETSNLIGLLSLYAETVPMKQTKTQATYKLPSGTLKRKFGTPEYNRDDKVLGAWLQSNNYSGMYETVYKPKWADLKKIIVVQDGKVIDPDSGIVVEGVTAEMRPDSFVVEVE